MGKTLDLNQQQLDVVHAPSGRIVCIAGPGSGKTASMIAKIAHEIENGLPPQTIVAMTFTNKARDEIRNRLKDSIGEDKAKLVEIGTIHGWCSKNIIRVDPSYFGFKGKIVKVSTDYEDILFQIYPRGDKERDKETKQIGEYFSKCVSRGMQIEDDFSDVFERMRKLQFEMGWITCDDIIYFAHLRLKNDEKFRKQLASRYRLVIIDEAQDSSLQQAEIANYLSEVHNNIICVGDDHQAIFTWRNAYPEHFLGLIKKGYTTYRLEQNYRSPQSIVDLTNAIVKFYPEAVIEKELIAYNPFPNAPKPKLRIFGNGSLKESDWIANLLYQKINFEGETPSNIAILCRSVNAVYSRFIQGSLLKRGIKYTIVGGADIFKHPGILALFATFNLACDANFKEDWVTILDTFYSAGPKTAQKIADKAPDRKKMLDMFPPRLEVVKDDFDEYFSLLDSIRFHQTDIPYCVEVFKKWYLPIEKGRQQNTEKTERIFENFVQSSLVFEDISEALENFILENDVKDKEDKDMSEHVTISTIHRAKGREFKTVIIPSVDDDTLPHKNSKKELSMRGLHEENRLLYVAVSRAKWELYLTATIDDDHILSRYLTKDIREKYLDVKYL